MCSGGMDGLYRCLKVRTYCLHSIAAKVTAYLSGISKCYAAGWQLGSPNGRFKLQNYQGAAVLSPTFMGLGQNRQTALLESELSSRHYNYGELDRFAGHKSVCDLRRAGSPLCHPETIQARIFCFPAEHGHSNRFSNLGRHDMLLCFSTMSPSFHSRCNGATRR